MTEAEWLMCTDPEALQCLRFTAAGDRRFTAAGDRKLRLFAVAACRHSLRCFGHYELDVVVDAAERLADGQDVDLEVESIRGTVEWATFETCESLNCLGAAVSTMIEPDWLGAGSAYQIADWIQDAHYVAAADSTAEEEAMEQANLLRDIFGNPFRPVAVDPAWLTEAAVGIARGIYDDRAFERLPILADALQEAGCEDAELLAHCREPGTHVRGCWVVDLVLGKG